MTTVAPTTGEATDSPYALSHLDALESEAVHIFREVAGEFER
ncbi:sulfate adenylyltransferase small subunit, partial [Streptomyces sp. NPDC056121]